MSDWFSSLELFSQVYWGIALLGSFIFVITMILSFVGSVGVELDIDSEIESDTGIGFQFITLKNLIGFFTLFGWSGIACIDAGFTQALTIVISISCGLIMMAIMAAMFFYMSKLNHSGTLNVKNAIGEIGEVYLTIRANRTSIGKVHVRIQGALRELEALTDAETDLKTGSVIQVKDITNNGILIVEQLTK